MASRWIWVSGWAIAPDRFRSAVERALPDDSHQVLAPKPDALATVRASDADRIGGYSLGSLILLSALQQLPEAVPILCLAPFISFCKEDSSGGTTPAAMLQALQQRLRTRPQKALQLFYRLAGLTAEPSHDLPYPAEHLEWGLDQLAHLKADTTLLTRVSGIAGLTDPLINCNEMRAQWQACNFVEECSHDYQQLLTALTQMDSTQT